MKCYYALYMDEKVQSQQEKILKRIHDGKWQLEKYLIALAPNEKNHLEIYNSVLLIQKAIPKEEVFLVGVAGGYAEALELVEKITQEVYDETGGTDIRSFILCKQQEYEKGNV